MRGTVTAILGSMENEAAVKSWIKAMARGSRTASNATRVTAKTLQAAIIAGLVRYAGPGTYQWELTDAGRQMAQK